MKIAVPYADGQVYQHFGHTAQFKLYETAHGKILSSQLMDTNGSGHGALAGFLAAQGVDTVICGGIGEGAQSALAAANIRLLGGVQGAADEAVLAYLSGALVYDPNVKCSHNGHHGHHGEGHHGGGCGEHGGGHCHHGSGHCHH
nr:NifB/NifX family molybdenum-iron cluster-binding protein [uncultured Agathobaculum sp.]